MDPIRMQHEEFNQKDLSLNEQLKYHLRKTLQLITEIETNNANQMALAKWETEHVLSEAKNYDCEAVYGCNSTQQSDEERVRTHREKGDTGTGS